MVEDYPVKIRGAGSSPVSRVFVISISMISYINYNVIFSY